MAWQPSPVYTKCKSTVAVRHLAFVGTYMDGNNNLHTPDTQVVLKGNFRRLRTVVTCRNQEL
jgi:hypothetical protein